MSLSQRMLTLFRYHFDTIFRNKRFNLYLVSDLTITKKIEKNLMINGKDGSTLIYMQNV